MANKNPKRPPSAVLFKNQWQTGKTIQKRIPIAIEQDVIAIAQCLDQNPSIASQVLAFAKALADQTAN